MGYVVVFQAFHFCLLKAYDGYQSLDPYGMNTEISIVCAVNINQQEVHHFPSGFIEMLTNAYFYFYVAT